MTYSPLSKTLKPKNVPNLWSFTNPDQLWLLKNRPSPDREMLFLDPDIFLEYNVAFFYCKVVLVNRIRIRMFLGLPDPDSLVRGTDLHQNVMDLQHYSKEWSWSRRKFLIPTEFSFFKLNFFMKLCRPPALRQCVVRRCSLGISRSISTLSSPTARWVIQPRQYL